MIVRRHKGGFTLIEVIVAVALFVIFFVGIYGAFSLVFKIVYASRVQIVETSALDEQLEIIKNLPYDSIGVVGGVPSGILPASQTIGRDGVTLYVTTTVRNVDDPADGVIGGTPNDTAPADYKLVEVSAQCATCNQKVSLVLSTTVSPKRLEGASKNGALFVHVFDADGNDLPGATVHITNASTTPAIDLTDVTDDNGMYELVDTPTSSLGYNITVSEPGYSTDYTIPQASTTPSDSTKLPASVLSQTITEINFAIDQLSSLAVTTENFNCSAIGSQTLTITGDKLIGTDPDIPKFTKTFSTNGAGAYSLPSLEWDNYSVIFNGAGHDVAGTIPLLPLALDPGVSQNLSLVLVPPSTNSLLVKVIDSGTGLPVSGASVQIFDSGGASQTLITGVGYMRQTDWSGGSGQVSYVDTTQYWSDSGTVDIKSPKGDLTLTKSGHTYLSSGWLQSSTFDLGTTVNFNNIIFTPLTQPTQVGGSSVQVQIATSNSSTPASWNFTGPDGTASTYYTPQSTLVNAINNGRRYLRYKVYLATANTSYTPDLSELAFTYTTACTPPGQAFFSNIAADTYTLTVSSTGYDAASDSVDVSGYTTTDVDLSESQ